MSEVCVCALPLNAIENTKTNPEPVMVEARRERERDNETELAFITLVEA